MGTERLLEDTIILFSGRFDPVHVGHICSMRRLLNRYKWLEIVILDHPKRRFPAFYSKQIIEEVLAGFRINVRINTTHFSEITLKELKSYKSDLYAAGNMEVLKHISSLGFPCIWVDRAYHFQASKIA